MLEVRLAQLRGSHSLPWPAWPAESTSMDLSFVLPGLQSTAGTALIETNKAADGFVNIEQTRNNQSMWFSSFPTNLYFVIKTQGGCSCTFAYMFIIKRTLS